MISSNDWKKFSNYFRTKLIFRLDETQPFIPDDTLQQNFEVPHKGFYVDIIDSSGIQIALDGFLEENLNNVILSADLTMDSVCEILKSKNITVAKLHTSTFHFCIIFDVIYLPNPMAWDDKVDGVYFQWGQRFKSFYLPHQVKSLNMHKSDVLDRLCSSAGTVSNLWKLPEGLIFALKNESHTS